MKCIKKKMTSETISPSSYQTSFISFLKWTKTNFFMQIVILAWFLIIIISNNNKFPRVKFSFV